MKPSSWLVHLIPGMATFSPTCRLNASDPSYLVRIAATFTIMRNTIWLWMILFIVAAPIQSSVDVSPMTKLREFWMTVTLELVAVIYLEWQPRRKSVGQDTSGLHSLKTALKLLRSVHHANSSFQSNAHIRLCSIQLLLSAPLQNGVLTTCIVALPQPGA